MELRIFINLFFTALAFLIVGRFAYLKPQYFGGVFKLSKAVRPLTIKHSISSNRFVITNTKKIGGGLLISGIMMALFSIAYLFYPEVLLIFHYANVGK